jgi:predicted RNase H-like HicB family nuclease
MLTRRFKVLIERDREAAAWVTYVPALDYLSTFGDTRDEALENTREAILGYFEAAAKEGLEMPASDSEAELVDLEIAIV